MPTREVRNKARLTVNTIILLLKLKDANCKVKPLLKSLSVSEENFLNNDITEGRAVKVKVKAIRIPITIIFPKSITGLISLTERDAKATMVVNAV